MAKIGPNMRAQMRHMANHAKARGSTVQFMPAKVLALLDYIMELETVKSSAEHFIERTGEIGEDHPAYEFLTMALPLARALGTIVVDGAMELDDNEIRDTDGRPIGVARQQGKVRNFGEPVTPLANNGYVQQAIADQAKDSIVKALNDAADKFKAVELRVRMIIDPAFRFFGGLNIQDFPMLVQRKYVEQVAALGKLLRGPAWYEIPPEAKRERSYNTLVETGRTSYGGELKATGDQTHAEERCKCAGCEKARVAQLRAKREG